MRCYFKYKNYI